MKIIYLNLVIVFNTNFPFLSSAGMAGIIEKADSLYGKKDIKCNIRTDKHITYYDRMKNATIFLARDWLIPGTLVKSSVLALEIE